MTTTAAMATAIRTIITKNEKILVPKTGTTIAENGNSNIRTTIVEDWIEDGSNTTKILATITTAM